MKLKSIVAVLVCMVLLSGVVAGCNAGKSDQDTVLDGTETIENGTHSRNVTETDDYLVADGKTEYRILMPADEYPLEVENARSDFVSLFFEATGIWLESDTVVQAGVKYISIGDTALYRNSGETAQYSELGRNGFRLFTKDGNIFCVGAQGGGTANAVYELLTVVLNFEQYGVGNYDLDTNVESLKFFDLDITEVPDIQICAASYGVVSKDAETRRRMRMVNYTDVMTTAVGSSFHNSFDYIPVSEYTVHPEWFSGPYSKNYTQLCYTAHGDENSRNLMIDYVADHMIAGLIADTETTAVTFSQEDSYGNSWCACDACKAAKDKYGADSGALIDFLNQVARRVRAWQSTAGDTRTIDILTFAYRETITPPVKTINGVDQPTIICDDNVGILCAPINAVYGKTLNGPDNEVTAKNLTGWGKVTDTVYFWTYDTNFRNYMAPFDTFGVLKSNIQYLYRQNAQYLFAQGQMDNGNSTGFSALKQYLISKLCWNVNADIESLTEAYFENAFGSAKEYVKEAYYKVLARLKYNTDVLEMSGSIYTECISAEYWPKGTLEDILRSFDAAFEIIKPLEQSNPVLFARLRRNITLESLSYRFMQLRLYARKYPANRQTQMIQSFNEDFTQSGITHLNEGNLVVDDIFTVS